MNDIVTLHRDYQQQCDFLTVYIKEAHPSDGWMLPNAIRGGHCRQHLTIEERRAIANEFIQDNNYKLPFFLDSMKNEACIRYQAWPERLYIIQDGVVVYKGMVGPFGYNVWEVRRWLENRFASK